MLDHLISSHSLYSKIETKNVHLVTKKIILLPHFSLQEKMKTMHYYYEKKTSINEEKLCVKYF